MSKKDPFDDPDVKAWLDRAEREMFPKMKASAMSMVLNNGKPDAKLALEVGAAILFNKPLLIVCFHGQAIPPMLRSVASAVVEVDDMNSPADKSKIQRALELMLRRPA